MEQGLSSADSILVVCYKILISLYKFFPTKISLTKKLNFSLKKHRFKFFLNQLPGKNSCLKNDTKKNVACYLPRKRDKEIEVCCFSRFFAERK